MVLGSTQPLTEISTSKISRGNKTAGAQCWQPLPSCGDSSTYWNLQGVSRPVQRFLYLLNV
jgi:hypothetical protein